MRRPPGIPTRRGPAADVARVRQGERLAAVYDAQQDKDFHTVLNTPEGRRFVWRVLAQVCGTFKASYTGNTETFFREGKRDVGLQLVEDAQRSAPELYLLMQQEALRDARDHEIRQEARASTTDEGSDG